MLCDLALNLTGIIVAGLVCLAAGTIVGLCIGIECGATMTRLDWWKAHYDVWSDQ